MNVKTFRRLTMILVLAILIGVSVIVGLLIYKSCDKEKRTEYEYSSADVQKYIDYLYCDDDSTYLMLVNLDNSIGTYEPSSLLKTDLIKDCKIANQTYYVEERTLYALTAMLIEAKACGYDKIRITSAYRSYTKQNSIFNNYIAEEMEKDPTLTREAAEEIVKKYSNPPGRSEHQTGLTVDFYAEDDGSTVLNTGFAYTDEGRWLAANCHKFGFVLRYGADKTDITGISYEPWHFRYVGIEHAAKMKELNMCLEEYIEYLGK